MSIYNVPSSYVYENGKRYNENDGLLFTPEEYPYKPSRSTITKKWKWPSLNTVDFFIQVVSEARGPGRQPRKVVKFHIWAGQQQRHVEFRTVFFRPQCMQRLLADLQGETQAVIECSYESAVTGEWQYIRLRPDKPHANHLSVAFQRMESVADNLTTECLRKQFVPNSSTSQGHPRSQARDEAHMHSTPTETPTPVDVRSVESRTPTPVDVRSVESRTPTPVDVRSVEDRTSPEYNNDVIYSTPPDKVQNDATLHGGVGRKRAHSDADLDDNAMLDEDDFQPSPSKKLRL